MDLETRESLIARLPNHADFAAWQEFVELYEPLVFGLARRHGFQANDAHDVVQEVFSAVAESIDRFSPDKSRGRFRTWLFRVARNQTLNQLRKRKRNLPLSGEPETQAMLESQADGQPDDDEFDSAFRRRAFRWAARRVRQAVQPTTWECFSRTAIGGEQPKAVAEDLGIDVGTVYLARSRVMVRMRKLVETVSCESLAADSGESGEALL